MQNSECVAHKSLFYLRKIVEPTEYLLINDAAVNGKLSIGIILII